MEDNQVMSIHALVLKKKARKIIYLKNKANQEAISTELTKISAEFRQTQINAPALNQNKFP